MVRKSVYHMYQHFRIMCALRHLQLVSYIWIPTSL